MVTGTTSKYQKELTVYIQHSGHHTSLYYPLGQKKKNTIKAYAICLDK
jgi:hypothetical protein